MKRHNQRLPRISECALPNLLPGLQGVHAVDFAELDELKFRHDAKAVQPSSCRIVLISDPADCWTLLSFRSLPHCVDQDLLCSKAPLLHGRYPASPLLRT